MIFSGVLKLHFFGLDDLLVDVDEREFTDFRDEVDDGLEFDVCELSIL